MTPTEDMEQQQAINNAASKEPPTTEQLKAELRHEKYKRSFVFSLRNTIFTLVTVAAAAVLIAVLVMPVLQIYGSSMTPTLAEGEIVVSVKGTDMKTGDIVAFYYNNNVLIKRVIAQPGDWVDISEDGTVFVNNEVIDEPYITGKAFGECNIQLPYQVPDSRIFVMGDHRSVSIDSRNTAVGCVADEQIVGKIIFRVWPLNRFGKVA